MTSPRQLLLEHRTGEEADQAEEDASQEHMNSLLAAVAGGRVCRVRTALRLHFSLPQLMVAQARSLLAGNARVAALLLRRTHRLPMPEEGQCGSLPDLDGVMAATVRHFVASGGLAAAGGWGRWGDDHLYQALEVGMLQTAAALYRSGARLPVPEGLQAALDEGHGGGTAEQRRGKWAAGSTSCLHTLAHSTHAWGRPELELMARRLVALGDSRTALDAQGRTPLQVACEHRLARNRGRLYSWEGLNLLLELSSPQSTARGGVMQAAARQGDYCAVAFMARGGGRDEDAMAAALQLAVANRCLEEDEAALRLCGAGLGERMAAGAAGAGAPVAQGAQRRSAPPQDAARLLMRSPACTFHPAALMRILDLHPVTAAELAAAAADAVDPDALRAARKSGYRASAELERDLGAHHVKRVVEQELRPFLLSMKRLQGESAPVNLAHSRRRRKGRSARAALPPLPDLAIDRVCVFLILNNRILC